MTDPVLVIAATYAGANSWARSNAVPRRLMRVLTTTEHVRYLQDVGLGTKVYVIRDHAPSDVDLLIAEARVRSCEIVYT